MVEVVQDSRIDELNRYDGRWMVIIYNNATNSIDEVIEILLIATKCDLNEAVMEVWEAENYGKAPVHFADQSECERVADIVSSIGVQTEVSREWGE